SHQRERPEDGWGHTSTDLTVRQGPLGEEWKVDRGKATNDDVSENQRQQADTTCRRRPDQQRGQHIERPSTHQTAVGCQERATRLCLGGGYDPHTATFVMPAPRQRRRARSSTPAVAR